MLMGWVMANCRQTREKVRDGLLRGQSQDDTGHSSRREKAHSDAADAGKRHEHHGRRHHSYDHDQDVSKHLHLGMDLARSKIVGLGDVEAQEQDVAQKTCDADQQPRNAYDENDVEGMLQDSIDRVWKLQGRLHEFEGENHRREPRWAFQMQRQQVVPLRFGPSDEPFQHPEDDGVREDAYQHSQAKGDGAADAS